MGKEIPKIISSKWKKHIWRSHDTTLSFLMGARRPNSAAIDPISKTLSKDLQGNTQQTYTPLQRRAFSRWGRPSSFSALLSFFGLRRSGLSGSWPRTLFWSQTSSAVGSSRRRCISPSDIQRSSISDGYSAGLFIGTRPGPAARTKNLSPKPIVNKRPLCLPLFCWVTAENADLNKSSGTVLLKVTENRNC